VFPVRASDLRCRLVEPSMKIFCRTTAFLSPTRGSRRPQYAVVEIPVTAAS